MDTSALKVLISAQDQAYRSALEVFAKQFEDKITSLQSTVTELTTSLEFSQKEIEDLKHTINNQNEVNNDLKDKLQASEVHFKDLYERCNYQEDYNRRNNLRITGMAEQRSETWEQTAQQVSKLLKDKLQLPDIQLERAHRVGQRQDNHERTIVARFTRYADRDAVMRNAAKLKGTKIFFVNEDLCPASQKIRQEKMPMLRQARSEGKLAYFRHTKLIVKERTTPNHQSGPVRSWNIGTASVAVSTPNHQSDTMKRSRNTEPVSGAGSMSGCGGDGAGGDPVRNSRNTEPANGVGSMSSCGGDDAGGDPVAAASVAAMGSAAGAALTPAGHSGSGVSLVSAGATAISTDGDGERVAAVKSPAATGDSRKGLPLSSDVTTPKKQHGMVRRSKK